MDSNAIMPNVISSIIVIFLVWMINNSLKFFLKSTMTEMLKEIKSDIADLSEIAVKNRNNNHAIKGKIESLSNDVYKLEKTTHALSAKISTVKCLIGKDCHCENSN